MGGGLYSLCDFSVGDFLKHIQAYAPLVCRVLMEHCFYCFVFFPLKPAFSPVSDMAGLGNHSMQNPLTPIQPGLCFPRT